MEISRHEDTCVVQQVGNSSKNATAEILDFKEQDRLTVVLNKSVKLPMKWNGRLYEGRMAGMDFVTTGPKITKTSTGR
jgi:hypothetical protein